MYFDKQGYPYEKSMGIDELFEELKKWEKQKKVIQHIQKYPKTIGYVRMMWSM